MSLRQPIIVACLVLFGVTLRLMPHAPNIAPLTAIALFAGAVLLPRFAVLAALLTAVVSDLLIGWYDLAPVVWLTYALIALLSHALLRNPGWRRWLPGSLAASTIFFLVTNFAVWVSSGMYAHTLRGLVECFTLALPFFRNSLLADAGYLAVLFGCTTLFRTVVVRGILSDLSRNRTDGVWHG